MPASQDILTDDFFHLLETDYQQSPWSKSHHKLEVLRTLQKCTIADAAKVFGHSRTTIRYWVYRYHEGGLSNLHCKARRPNQRKLSPEHIEQMKRWIIEEAEQNWTLKKLGQRIYDQFGISSSKTAIWNVLKLQGFSHITGRKVHYKQKQGDKLRFKKNS